MSGWRTSLSAIDAAALRANRTAPPAHVAVLHGETEVSGVQLGDEAVLWGRQNGAAIGVTEVAARQETIAYEVLTGVGKRVPRILQ